MTGMATKRTIPEPEMMTGCLGPLDGRNLGAFNTELRARGVSDNDRIELVKFASMLDPKLQKGGAR